MDSVTQPRVGIMPSDAPEASQKAQQVTNRIKEWNKALLSSLSPFASVEILPPSVQNISAPIFLPQVRFLSQAAFSFLFNQASTISSPRKRQSSNSRSPWAIMKDGRIESQLRS